MTYEIYRYIFFGGAILSGVLLLTAIALFFLLRIPTVIGDLTGSNARKAIESIRNQNASTGNKTYKSSPVNRERGKLTDKISPSGRLIKNSSGSMHGAMSTGKIGVSQQETLATNSETTMLTGELVRSEAETTVLTRNNHANETAVLNAQSDSNDFVIECEITCIHTNEIIA